MLEFDETSMDAVTNEVILNLVMFVSLVNGDFLCGDDLWFVLSKN